ncbi:MAG TPA: hypothetical protein VFK06_12600 [Candidatus Angelobacter sp.]|nr:hypothetical protein [Candidatus Angelobacter sp.]
MVLSFVAVAAAVTLHVVTRPAHSVYLLPDGNLMAYVNFTPMHLMNMDAGGFNQVPEYQRLMNESGMGGERSIENIAVSANVDGSSLEDMAIIVTGAVDQQRISDGLKQQGPQAETYRGKTIFSNRVENRTLRYCVLDTKMLAVTMSPAAESMHAIIDKSAGSGSAPYLFKSYYSEVPFASEAWAIVHVPSFAVPDSPGGVNLDFLKNSVTILSARYLGSLSLRGEFIAENQADAANISKAAEGFLAIGKLAGSQQQADPDVTAIVNSIEVKQNGNHVVVSAAIPPEVIRKAAQKR